MPPQRLLPPLLLLLLCSGPRIAAAADGADWGAALSFAAAFAESALSTQQKVNHSSGHRYSYSFSAASHACSREGVAVGGRPRSASLCAQAAGAASCSSFMYSEPLRSCVCCSRLFPERNDTARARLYSTHEVLDCAEFATPPSAEAHGSLDSTILHGYHKLWWRLKDYLDC
ncbi:hypothetical protein EMIHUDRAFT_204407 [Emiliania huxleyi CCMP1516]|uniref:Pherophorin domain-containing protein n=2 Tax=Emiliania huxleyi TaxID=2903 RepID=A0A0D3JYC6_EMIH1|nr:hypothetical protein EMIHUDRAFT_204407 [Emiliania huxleyi CCMP1516]EOD28511.1 hypothetical protein EMIHUDRAFT_204407 [Emiliania huxleyi CCMP1516]|eukprot:XP_005780940.1 hypothetical protein EMIHUDRAFT_204407 [Emiliania huxleyi CCMP1516]